MGRNEKELRLFFLTAGQEAIGELHSKLPEGKEIYPSGWTKYDNIGPLVQYGCGFSSGSISKGDYLIMNTKSGKIGRYLILEISLENDPSDMFWAYVVCSGFK